jgi:IS6 family transposase
MGATMHDFKWKHFKGEIILGCVRWYCKYGISYRDLEEMMLERGVEVDHSTLYRWVQQYAPELEKRLRWFYRPRMGESWKVDETYIKVKGKWKYLYRAITKSGDTLDFYLSATRNARAAKVFLGKILRKMKSFEKPNKINTDQAPSYSHAIEELKREGLLNDWVVHRKIKYLNNRIESDHGKLKRLIKPTLGFKSMKTAFATIKGFEVMRMFRKGQLNVWFFKQGLRGEIRFIERQFGL